MIINYYFAIFVHMQNMHIIIIVIILILSDSLNKKIKFLCEESL